MAWRLSSAVLLLTIAAQASELQRVEAVEPHMGTLFRITLFAPDAEQAQRAIRKAFQRAAELDRTFSDYLPDSEAMRLCRSAAGAPVRVSDDLFTVVESAQRLAAETGGAFDITVGPLTHLWRSGRAPDEAALALARAHVGYRKLSLDPRARTIELAEQGMILDFGAIAKGYAADSMLSILRTEGIARALVAASGDLAIGDPPPGKAGWRVGLDSFKAPANGFSRTLTLRNIAVSSSGDTEQFVKRSGRRYSHIIDPKAGLGITERSGVSVLARRGLDADALATTLSVLGVDRGMALIEQHADAAAIFITSSGETESSRFRSLSR